jgi:hypothetical protein
MPINRGSNGQLSLRIARVTLFLLLGIPLTLVSSTARAADSSVTFGGPSPLVLTTGSSVPVSLENNSAESWSYHASAYYDIADNSQVHIPIPIGTASGVLAAGGVAIIDLGPSSQTHAKTVSGFVVATAKASDGKTIVARAPLTSATPSATPGLDKWSGMSVARWPGDTSTTPANLLPLIGDSCSASDDGTAYVQAGAAAIIAVPYSCKTMAGKTAVKFDVWQLGKIGSYEGKATIGGTNVALSYVRTTSIIWPLLAILAGFLAAAAQQAWVNNTRPLHRLENRLGEIGEIAVQAQNEFRDLSGTESYRRFTIVPGVATEIARLNRQTSELRPSFVRRWFLAFVPWSFTERQEDYDKLLVETAILEESVKNWPLMPGLFARLKSSLVRLESADSGYIAPGLIADAKVTLDPNSDSTSECLLDFAAAKDLIQKVPDTITALALIDAAQQINKPLADMTEGELDCASDTQVLEEARRLYQQARAELLLAVSAADVQEAGVDQLLREVRSRLLQLKPPVGNVRPQTVDEGDAEIDVAKGPVVGLISLFPRLITALFGGKAGVVRAVDTTWLLVAVLVAAWTGLTAMYLGKAWGDWQDYLAMFAWAFGATAVLTPILSSLERVATGALPLKPSKGE